MKISAAIKSTRVLLPEGIKEAVVLIGEEKIIEVLTVLDYEIAIPVTDVGDRVVMPGIIDPHVHINEPGRTEWEGFETATTAAAYGGITTLIEMPLNASPVTTTKNNFEVKLDAAKNKMNVNCGFWGGVVPDNYNHLEALLESGVFGMKAFLTHSGIDDFANTTANDLRKALLLLKKYNKPLLVHCELDTMHDDLKLLEHSPRNYNAYLKSRPKAWENKAIELMIDLCRETGAKVHIVHLSSADAIVQIEKAKRDGLPLTVETAPHYLFFNAEEIPDGATQYKCAPPIREKENNEQLWNALREWIIDFIATDHSPAPPALKEIDTGNFKNAWGGIAGLQFSLPAVWTAASQQNFSINDIAKWLCVNPARFINLDSSKGKIKKGFDADIVIWNPDKKFMVTENSIQHRHKTTPYLNRELYGVVEQTYVNGKKVFDNSRLINRHEGKILLQ